MAWLLLAIKITQFAMAQVEGSMYHYGAMNDNPHSFQLMLLVSPLIVRLFPEKARTSVYCNYADCNDMDVSHFFIQT